MPRAIPQPSIPRRKGGTTGYPCAHKWVFLRQNTTLPVPPDVFFCEKCLAKREVPQ